MPSSIKNIINTQCHEINNILKDISNANKYLQECLPNHLKKICNVSYFSKGQLILNINNANYATEIHYLLPELRNQLRHPEMLPQLSNIKYTIYSVTVPKSLNNINRAKLNLATKNLWLALSENCSHPELKKALKNITK